jgi:hypothetical protein
VWNYFQLLSGGLRYAATTGYYLTAFQADRLTRWTLQQSEDQEKE